MESKFFLWHTESRSAQTESPERDLLPKPPQQEAAFRFYPRRIIVRISQSASAPYRMRNKADCRVLDLRAAFCCPQNFPHPCLSIKYPVPSAKAAPLPARWKAKSKGEIVHAFSGSHGPALLPLRWSSGHSRRRPQTRFPPVEPDIGNRFRSRTNSSAHSKSCGSKRVSNLDTAKCLCAFQ